MNIKFKYHHSTDHEKSITTQPWGVLSWKRNTIDKDPKESTTTQPWGVLSWERNMIDKDPKESTTTQPWGVLSWKRNRMEKDPEKPALTQPWGVLPWKRNKIYEDSEKLASTQPWGVSSWKRNTMNKERGVLSWERNTMDKDSDKSTSTQPWGVLSWKRNTIHTFTQPWGVESWKRNTMDTSTQLRGVESWKRNTMDTSTQPWGVRSWGKSTMKDDPKKLTMEEICNGENFVGEDNKFCAESVESLLDFVISKLGKDIEELTSSFIAHRTQYKIVEGVQRVSSDGVMCHKLNFGKPIFYCHQVNATITYSVPMEAIDGTRTSAVALCHHDTRGLDPHTLFNDLKVMPGTVPVCHFLGSGAIAWVPRNNKAAF